MLLQVRLQQIDIKIYYSLSTSTDRHQSKTSTDVILMYVFCLPVLDYGRKCRRCFIVDAQLTSTICRVVTRLKTNRRGVSTNISYPTYPNDCCLDCIAWGPSEHSSPARVPQCLQAVPWWHSHRQYHPMCISVPGWRNTSSVSSECWQDKLSWTFCFLIQYIPIRNYLIYII